MTYEPKEREILDQVVAALHGHYGERLSRVVLFGSRARRDHTEFSDFDLLVVLNDEPNQRIERKAISDIVWPICLGKEAVIQCSAVSKQRMETDQTALFRNVREEGVSL
jgi:predicted nucleotidyltransferase